MKLPRQHMDGQSKSFLKSQSRYENTGVVHIKIRAERKLIFQLFYCGGEVFETAGDTLAKMFGRFGGPSERVIGDYMYRLWYNIAVSWCLLCVGKSGPRFDRVSLISVIRGEHQALIWCNWITKRDSTEITSATISYVSERAEPFGPGINH